MLQKLPSAIVNLMLFRQGPQDFPWDGRIHPGLVMLAGLAIALRLALAMPIGVAAVTAMAYVGALATGARIVLRTRRLDNRFQQTYHALVATMGAFNLMMLWPFAEIAPALAQLMTAAEAGKSTADVHVDLPMASVGLIAFLEIWSLAVWAWIFRHAADVSAGSGLFIALVVNLSVGFFASLVRAIGQAIVSGAPTPAG
jgi:hypothetical protein